MANCLDVECIVDRDAPKKVVYTCQIVTSSSYITYGGYCNKQTCRTKIWSGPAKKDFCKAARF